MAFEIFTDSSSNLMPDQAKEYGIHVIPLHTIKDGKETPCYDENTTFDGKTFYDYLREKNSVKTSMINADQFTTAFEPVLKEGKDLLCVNMSSGISGTFTAAVTAAQALTQAYPDRIIRVVDTLSASFGEGLFVIKASKMRKEGKSVLEAAAWIEQNRMRMCQVFTVDDLMFLRRGGRISGISALIGTLVNIKPLLKGNEDGKIIVFSKVMGRKKALQALANTLADNIGPDSDAQLVGIAHGDCESEANYLCELIRKKTDAVKDIIVRTYEPGTGAHVGPGAMALFFFGKDGSFRKHHLSLLP